VLCLRESSTGLLKLKLLQLISDVFAAIHHLHNFVLDDSEIASIISHLIDRSGHKSERHRGAFHQSHCGGWRGNFVE
jgi:hypothetical protein